MRTLSGCAPPVNGRRRRLRVLPTKIQEALIALKADPDYPPIRETALRLVADFADILPRPTVPPEHRPFARYGRVGGTWCGWRVTVQKVRDDMAIRLQHAINHPPYRLPCVYLPAKRPGFLWLICLEEFVGESSGGVAA